ncbi:MAG: hypothetical protein QF464_02865, partial [Myxococcota bacterium]|nr:hypothetical protein [Myxococcota bacterium]
MLATRLRIHASLGLTLALTIALSACSSDGGDTGADTSAGTVDTIVDTDASGADGGTSPEADTNQTVEDATEPGEDATEPGEDTTEPVEDATEPVEDTTGDGQGESCQVNADCEHLSADMPCYISVCEFGDCLTVQQGDNIACDDGNPCTLDDVCTEGTCDGVEDLTAEGCEGAVACESATVIDTLPFTSASTTIDTVGYYASTDCPGPAEGKGQGSNDALYVMNVAESGTYVFALSDLSDDPEGLDAVLYLVEGCPGLGSSTCIAAQDIWFKHGKEEIAISLEAGTMLYVVVDGYGSDENIEGNFELVVTEKQPPEADCGDGADNDDDGATDCDDPGCTESAECLATVPGALCDNAIVVDSLPYLYEGSTQDMGNEFHIADETCPDAGDTEFPLGMFGMASDDVFFSFTPNEDGTYV